MKLSRLFLLVNLIALQGIAQPDQEISADERAALFDDLYTKTLKREAFSLPKNERLGLDFAQQALALRDEFIRADTDKRLYLALLRLSALRRDRHLRVYPTQGGLRVDLDRAYVPLRFAPDFSVSDSTVLFVYDVAKRAKLRPTPAVGDVVVAVNGMPTQTFVDRIAAYVPSSTDQHARWVAAWALYEKRNVLDSVIYQKNALCLTLKNKDRTYELVVPYQPNDSFSWNDHRSFPGFRSVLKKLCFTLYKHREKSIMLIDWHRFARHFIDADLQALTAYVNRRRWWEYDLIVDATHAGGGTGAASVIALLADQPFRTTLGNVRCSDVLPQLAYRLSDQSDVGSWLRYEVIPQCRAGQAYSDNVPFKLAHLPKTSDGYAWPNPKHFVGRKAFLFSSRSGSHLDQFAAMVIDNQIGYSLGMPTAGFSNTWEWTEDVTVPRSKQLVVKYQWSVGQTIRPNGEVLEGNPAVPNDVVLFTRDNHRTYYDDLVGAVVNALTSDEQAAQNTK